MPSMRAVTRQRVRGEVEGRTRVVALSRLSPSMSLGPLRTSFKHKESSCSVLRERRSVSRRARKGDGPRKRVVARMLSGGNAKPIGGLQVWLPEYVKQQEKGYRLEHPVSCTAV
ncbi:hypothetical protein L227DRAFT_402439 [Lentinus tigrinus ALCF2SS1-6]|uniref:Uncharacterized protein n=1 Tax=Lentinus tigrinus ALCF2SS1-6 TaxID=1328759 RepID=A0A5C2RR18_9APHY|nr:hypothetical protein L227DRAFT_402439 [Lentinus tigrinus ALCF2SS1-6]